MKRIALLSAFAALTFAGCGGHGGGGGGGGVVPPPGPGLSRAQVNQAALNTPGRVEVTYNTGQGRAVGSPTAVIKRLFFEDNTYGLGDGRNTCETQLLQGISMQLDGYTSQSIGVDVPMSGFSEPLHSRSFDRFNLEIAKILVQNDAGGLDEFTGAGGGPILSGTNSEFDANVRAFPGRRTSVQIFLDDATLNHDGSNLVWDAIRFADLNYEPIDLVVKSFMADYLAFDISNVPNRPQLSAGGFATRVYFSGDSIAISGPLLGGAQPFEVLTPVGVQEGLFNPPVNLPNQTIPFGTYTLQTIDPTSLPNIAKITSLQGIWREYTNLVDQSKALIKDVGDFEFITMPQSGDGDTQDLVILQLNSSKQIINMYFGEVDFNTYTFLAWPIDQVSPAGVNGEISGTIYNTVDRNGNTDNTVRRIRSGLYSITGGTIPIGFNTSGRFIVYRL